MPRGQWIKSRRPGTRNRQGNRGAARIVAAVGEVVLLPVPADTASARTVGKNGRTN